MASWFYASEGKQQGPYPEGQFRDLISQGIVRPDTLVWSEGMAGWQKAAEIPGLIGGGAPPMVPAGGPPTMGGGGYAGGGGGSLSADFSAFGILGRSIVFIIGMLLVIPAPWVTVWFYKYITSHIQVPGRPNFGFAGEPMDIWWALMGNALLTYAGATGISYAPLLATIANAFFAWVILRWIVANLTSNGERLGQRDRLCRLVSLDAHLDHHHHRLGLGAGVLDALDLPQHRGYAARDRVHRQRLAGAVAHGGVLAGL